MKTLFTIAVLLLIFFTSCEKRECECPCLECELNHIDTPGRTSVEWHNLCTYEYSLLIGYGVDMKGLLSIQDPNGWSVKCEYE